MSAVTVILLMSSAVSACYSSDCLLSFEDLIKHVSMKFSSLHRMPWDTTVFIDDLLNRQNLHHRFFLSLLYLEMAFTVVDTFCCHLDTGGKSISSS